MKRSKDVSAYLHLNTQVQNISEVPHGIVHLTQLGVDLVHARIDSRQWWSIEEFLEVGDHGLQGVSGGAPQNLRNIVSIFSWRIIKHT